MHLNNSQMKSASIDKCVKSAKQASGRNTANLELYDAALAGS